MAFQRALMAGQYLMMLTVSSILVINEMNGTEFKTSEVIREYSGGFFAILEFPPYYPFNSQFGRLLRRNETRPRIVKIQSHISTNR